MLHIFFIAFFHINVAYIVWQERDSAVIIAQEPSVGDCSILKVLNAWKIT